MRLLAKLLGQYPQDDWASLEASATEFNLTDAFAEALAMSHGDLAQLLRTALRAAHPGEKTYVWTRDVYDDAVVYEVSSRDEETPTALYQRSYTVADGKVAFGDPIQVIAVTQYMPVEQAAITVPAVQVTQISQPAEESDATLITGNLVPLVERAVQDDGTALIKIIQAGQGSSGYYPADVLKRDGPKAFHEGLHIYLDHPSYTEDRDRPERSVKDLAGSLTGAAEWKEDGGAGPGLYAPVKFIDSVAPHINAVAPISGMSIRAFGKSGKREVDGKKVSTVESIDSALSVDVVTRPGAGGRVVEFLEAARTGAPAPKPYRPKEGDPMNLQEQLDAATTELEETKGKLGEAQQRIDQQDRDLARLREQNILREANAVIAETLADLSLHQLTRERLTKQLIAGPPVKDGDLDAELFKARVTEAAKAEQNYLVLSTGSAGVRGMGGSDPDVPSVIDSDKRISEALADL